MDNFLLFLSRVWLLRGRKREIPDEVGMATENKILKHVSATRLMLDI